MNKCDEAQKGKTMEEDKRIVNGYEITNAVNIGGMEVLFGSNEKSDMPYMVCNSSYIGFCDVKIDTDVVLSDNYLELMQEFTSRIRERTAAVKAEREKVTVPTKVITCAECDSISDVDLENKVIVIRPESILPEYRGADRQLCIAVGGFGCSPTARGSAVFTVNLYTGKESRWERYDVLGMIKPECMPDWAKERLGGILEKRREPRSCPER